MMFVQIRLRDDRTGKYTSKKFTFKTHMDDLKPNDVAVVDTNAEQVLHRGLADGYVEDPKLPYYKYVLATIERNSMANFLKRLEDNYMLWITIVEKPSQAV